MSFYIYMLYDMDNVNRKEQYMRYQQNCQHTDENARHPEARGYGRPGSRRRGHGERDHCTRERRQHGMRMHGRHDHRVDAHRTGEHAGAGHGHGRPGRNGHRRPTLGRSILKSARRIRHADLTPEQLQVRIADSVTHAEYMITMRTLHTISRALRDTAPQR